MDVPAESTPADMPTTEAAQTEQDCSDPAQVVLPVPMPALPITTEQVPVESESATSPQTEAAQVEEDRSELVQQAAAAVDQPSVQVMHF